MNQYDPTGSKHRQEVLARKFAFVCIAFMGMIMLAAVAIGQAPKPVNLGQPVKVAPLPKPVPVNLGQLAYDRAPRVALLVKMGAR